MAIFNTVEALDIGIEKEKKRRDFYGLVSEHFAQLPIKELFSRLRDWEGTHIVTFGKIRDRIQQEEVTETYPGELDAYLSTLIDDKLYNDASPALFAKNIVSPLDAINRGISFEKDAILFFRELAERTNASSRKEIEILIDEEKHHLIYLAELKRRYV